MSTWERVAPGVTWRAADVPFEAPSPDPVAWVTTPSDLRWVVVRLDLGVVTPSLVEAPQHHLADVTLDPGVIVAVDGGYFERDETPSGLLVQRGQELHGYGPRGGSGVLVLRGGRADVLDAGPRPALATPDVTLALQCGPRLVERGGVVGVHRDDGRRFARTAACVRDHGRTLDLVLTWAPDDPMRGPGLYQFSRLLAGPSPVGDATGCELALNLDGGPSTGVYLRGAPAARHDPIGPTPWLLVVRDPSP